MDILLVVLLVIIGVILIVTEMFLIPGFGVTGILGLTCLGGAVAAAYIYITPLAGHITLAISLVLCVVAIYLFLRHRTLDKMALKTDITSKVDLLSATPVQVGDTGVCISRLAPMGKVRIHDTEIEAKSVDAFLDVDTPILVTAIEGNTVVVRKA